MNSRQRKALRDSFFQRGVAAIQRYYGGEKYFCPICAQGFDRSGLTNGELTLEHSPPTAVGGKPIALTCRSCNSRAGHLFESNLSRREQITALMEIINGERRNERARISLQIGDTFVNTEVYQDDNGVRTLQMHKGNDPRAIDAVKQYLDQLNESNSWEGQQFHITSRVQYSQRLANLALLKSAFITAFAALGYRYAFDARLRSVREQILKPGEIIIEEWNVGIQHEQLAEYSFWYTSSIPGFIVKFGKSSVVLPWISGPTNLYDDLKARYERKESVQMTGKFIRWPTRLELVLDFPRETPSVSPC